MNRRMVKKVSGGWAVVLPDGTTGPVYFSRSDAFRASMKALVSARKQASK
jgi:hypothetical protein